MTRSKYRNVPTVINGLKFDSKMEASRYAELLLLERSSQPGRIRNIQRQVRFQLVGPVLLRGAKRQTPGIDYVADFAYEELAMDNRWYTVIEDCKGAITAVYRMKRHMMKALLGLDIRETKPRR